MKNIIKMLKKRTFLKKAELSIYNGNLGLLFKDEEQYPQELGEKLEILVSKFASPYNIEVFLKNFTPKNPSKLVENIMIDSKNYFDEVTQALKISKKYNIQLSKHTVSTIKETNNAEILIDLINLPYINKKEILEKMIKLHHGWAIMHIYKYTKFFDTATIQDALVRSKDIFEIRLFAENNDKGINIPLLQKTVVDSQNLQEILRFAERVSRTDKKSIMKDVLETKNPELTLKVAKKLKMTNNIEILTEAVTLRLNSKSNNFKL